jgi:uncharacterized membrane protein
MKHKCPRTRQIPEVAIIVKTQGQDFKIYLFPVFTTARGITGIPAIDWKSPLEFASMRVSSRTQLYISCTQIPHILDSESRWQESESVSEKLNKLKVTFAFYPCSDDSITQWVNILINQLITNDVNHFFTSQVVVWESDWALFNWFNYRNKWKDEPIISIPCILFLQFCVALPKHPF